MGSALISPATVCLTSNVCANSNPLRSKKSPLSGCTTVGKSLGSWQRLRELICRLFGVFGSRRGDNRRKSLLRKGLGQRDLTFVPGQVLGYQSFDICVDREVPNIVDRGSRHQRRSSNDDDPTKTGAEDDNFDNG